MIREVSQTPEHGVRRLMRRLGLRRAVTRVRHRGIDGRDVMLASYPRSGNTWVKFVLADLASGRDIGYAETERLIPTVGEHRHAPRCLPSGGRLVKTHEPYRRGYRRSIYIMRDPRDVAVSYARWLTGFGVRYESFDEFLDEFLAGRVGGYGGWPEHVAGWLEAGRRGADVLALRYEDVKADPAPTIHRAALFAGFDVPLERVELAVLRNTPELMRDKERADPALFKAIGWRSREVSFVGQATSGAWKGKLSDAQAERLRPLAELYESIAPR